MAKRTLGISSCRSSSWMRSSRRLAAAFRASDSARAAFDEVDTGVSGRAAQKVAEKLAQVSRRKQVLCVTHLPQLAAMAGRVDCQQVFF